MSSSSDERIFRTLKRYELLPLRSQLRSDKNDKKIDAIKKIITYSNAGKNMSVLFPDVVNCMQTDHIGLKKIIYLYLRDYAQINPDMAIMAVNTFIKDCKDPSPLIRALALRTMSYIRLDNITEYLCEPLRKGLSDEDPYVRKTAAICVAKLYDTNYQLVIDQGFVEQLKELLSDSNSMVVSNTIAVLSEMNNSYKTDYQLIEMNPQTVKNLLMALNECNEWGQVFILDSLVNYHPIDEHETQSICERIMPHLAHANSAVVLSAIKMLMKLMEMVPTDSDLIPTLTKKLGPPLVTLLSLEPEIQYVALRIINLIVQKKPEILRHEIKIFFLKYNDPINVKNEKLDIMIRLVSQKNIQQVLSELKEYANEVDVDFVRKSVRAIGRCAIKVDESAEQCISTLTYLIRTKVNYVVQESIVVIKDIFRKYPNKYESIISLLCENLDTLDEPEAKASMIWIIGEYAERIDNAYELLESFLDNFQDENTEVQLQLLTSIVKLFLKRPVESQDLVQHVLNLATQYSDNPDLRDRGFIYWRLLSTDPNITKHIVLAKKPLISEEIDIIEPKLLEELLSQIPSLASIFHKPSSLFIEGKTQLHTPLLSKYPSNVSQSTIISEQQELSIKDNLSMDLTIPCTVDTSTSELGVFSTTNIPTVSSSSVELHDLLHSINLATPTLVPTYVQPSSTHSSTNFSLDSLLTSDIQTASSLSTGLNDLFPSMDVKTPVVVPISVQPSSVVDLDTYDLDPLFTIDNLTETSKSSTDASGLNSLLTITDLPAVSTSNTGLFDNVFLLNAVSFCPPKQLWLASGSGKGLKIMGTFSRNNCQICMHLTLKNKTVAPMTEFTIQLNKNVFGLIPAHPLQIINPLLPKTSFETIVRLKTSGLVQRMEPITNLRVAIKNNIDILYYDCIIPINVFFVENGVMDKQMFLTMWKDIPIENEVQFTLKNVNYATEEIIKKMLKNNVFTISENKGECLVMLHQSLKLTNGIWVLNKLKIQTGNPNIILSLKSQGLDVGREIFQAYDAILHA